MVRSRIARDCRRITTCSLSMRDRMRKEVAAKHTIDQVLASKITAEYDEEWPTGRERFLRILFQELSAK